MCLALPPTYGLHSVELTPTVCFIVTRWWQHSLLRSCADFGSTLLWLCYVAKYVITSQMDKIRTLLWMFIMEYMHFSLDQILLLTFMSSALPLLVCRRSLWVQSSLYTVSTPVWYQGGIDWQDYSDNQSDYASVPRHCMATTPSFGGLTWSDTIEMNVVSV